MMMMMMRGKYKNTKNIPETYDISKVAMKMDCFQFIIDLPQLVAQFSTLQRLEITCIGFDDE